MKKSRIEILEKEPIRTAILKLAIPTMLSMVAQLVYNLTDTYFIGLTGNTNFVAAISLANPIFMMFQAIGNIFAVGSGSYISRKLGEKNGEEAKSTSTVAIYTAVGFGIVFSICFMLFKNPLLSVIGTDANTFDPTNDYLTVIVAFSAVQVLYVTLAGLVRSEGATHISMIGMMMGIVTNIILDPIFIFTLNKGVAGAAWATIIGNSVSVIFFICHFLFGKSLLSIYPGDFKPSARIYKETFNIGLPAALSMAIMSIAMIFVNVVASGYGVHVLAGHGIQMKVGSMGVMLIFGLAQGYQPFAGYSFGAKNYKRLKEGFIVTLIYSEILCVFFFIIFALFGSNLIGFFIDDPATVEAGVKFLSAFKWAVPLVGLQMVIRVTFQSAGKAIKSLLIALGRQCIAYLPLLFLLNAWFGFDGFVYAQPLADLVTAIASVLMSISFFREIFGKEAQTEDEAKDEQPVTERAEF